MKNLSIWLIVGLLALPIAAHLGGGPYPGMLWELFQKIPGIQDLESLYFSLNQGWNPADFQVI